MSDNKFSFKLLLSNLNLKKKLLLYILVPTLLLDIVTKYIIRTNLDLYESIPVIPGLFNIVYVLNPGAAFSFMADMNESYRQLFFVSVSVIASILLLIIYATEKSKAGQISFALILSGAIGNLLDRMFLGKVVDFLDFYVGTHHWPSFNIADSCITIGAILLIIDILFLRKRNSTNDEVNNK